MNRERWESSPDEYPDIGDSDRHDEFFEDFSPRTSISRLGGCLLVIVLLIVVVQGVFIAKMMLASPTDPSPVVKPDSPLADVVEPIRNKLSYDPAKARVVWKTYSGFADALDGPSGARMVNTRVLASVQSSLLKDLDTAGGTKVGKEIDAAIGRHVGITSSAADDNDSAGWEFKAFDDDDRRELVEICKAIASAAEGTL
ncbi:MAG: hypothetical protein AAFP90_04585 [Planctomycetota bacterium]